MVQEKIINLEDLRVFKEQYDLQVQKMLKESGGGNANITVDTEISETTKDSTNPVSTKAVYEAIQGMNDTILALINTPIAGTVTTTEITESLNTER